MMRIVAGKYRHRLIYWPEDPSIRPTKDRVREAIFAALNDIEGKTFLDLYAGSGSMGIEALSRGAKEVTFVDKGEPALKCVRENLKLLSIEDDYKIIKANDFDAALVSYSQLCTKNPQSLNYRFNYALCLYEQKKYKQAISVLVPIVEQNPKSAKIAQK